MKSKKIIDEISVVARLLWEKGWAERNAGNISINVTELFDDADPVLFRHLPAEEMKIKRPRLGGNIFIITPTGSRMREMTRNTMDQLCYLRISDDGSGITHLSPAIFESLFPVSGPATINDDFVTSGTHHIPSSELPAHLAIHEMLLRIRPEHKTVIHTHATELIALTQLPQYKSSDAINRLLWGMHPETAMFVPRGSGFVPYTLPGTEQIAEATVRELEDHSMVIWEKHGVFATGTTITQAFDTIDIMAKSAKIYFMVKQSGQEPEGLSDHQIDQLRNFI